MPALPDRFVWSLCGLLAFVPFVAARTIAAEPPITAVAFSPDGTQCVAASQRGISIYTWPDLTLLRTLESQVPSVHDIAFSPDGSQLLVAGGVPADEGRVELFAWPEGESRHTHDLHYDSISAVAWIDEAAFATGSLDHEAAIWDAASGTRRQIFSGHSRGVSSICLVVDSQRLVTAGRDHNLRVWELSSGDLVRTLNNHTRPVHQVAARPGATGLPMIASTSADQTVRFWQPTIGRLVRFAQLHDTPLALAWRPDGSQAVVTTTSGKLLVVDPDTAEVIGETKAIDGWAYAVAAHPDDGSFVVGGERNQLVRVAF